MVFTWEQPLHPVSVTLQNPFSLDQVLLQFSRTQEQVPHSSLYNKKNTRSVKHYIELRTIAPAVASCNIAKWHHQAQGGDNLESQGLDHLKNSMNGAWRARPGVRTRKNAAQWNLTLMTNDDYVSIEHRAFRRIPGGFAEVLDLRLGAHWERWCSILLTHFCWRRTPASYGECTQEATAACGGPASEPWRRTVSATTGREYKHLIINITEKLFLIIKN